MRTYCFCKNGEVTRPTPDKVRRIALALGLRDVLSSPSLQFAPVATGAAAATGGRQYVELRAVDAFDLPLDDASRVDDPTVEIVGRVV